MIPDILLMADANSAYTLADAAHLTRVQPDDDGTALAHDDIDHIPAVAIQTPICLDECIARASCGTSHPLHACRVSTSSSRVGGFHAAKQIHDLLRPSHSGGWWRRARIRHRPRAQHCALHASRFHATRASPPASAIGPATSSRLRRSLPRTISVPDPDLVMK